MQDFTSQFPRYKTKHETSLFSQCIVSLRGFIGYFSLSVVPSSFSSPIRSTLARDETQQGSQWGFHTITNVLETTLKGFMGMKRFPSLSS